MSTRLVPGDVVGAHDEIINGVSFAPDGNRFVAGDNAGGLVVYQRTAGPFAPTVTIRVPPYSEHSRPQVRDVAWAPDDAYIAVHESSAVWLRRPTDLVALASRLGGRGSVGIGGGGAWLGTLGESGVTVVTPPELRERRTYHIWRDYESTSVGPMGVDPTGPLIAVADDGGRDETEMAMILRHGTPRTTLIDVDRDERIAEIEVGNPMRELVFDPARDRLLASSYADIGVWRPDGQPLGRFRPYPDTSVALLAVTPAALVTVPVGYRRPPVSIDLWDPETYAPIAGAVVPEGFRPHWLAASPDGRTLLTTEYVTRVGYGIRIWSIEGTA